MIFNQTGPLAPGEEEERKQASIVALALTTDCWCGYLEANVRITHFLNSWTSGRRELHKTVKRLFHLQIQVQDKLASQGHLPMYPNPFTAPIPNQALADTEVNETQTHETQHLLTLENVNKNVTDKTICLCKGKGNKKG